MIELKFDLVFFFVLVTGTRKLQRYTKFEEYSAPKLATLPVLLKRKNARFSTTHLRKEMFFPVPLQRSIRLPDRPAKYP